MIFMIPKNNKWKYKNIKKMYKSLTKEIDSLDSDSLEHKLANICVLKEKIDVVENPEKVWPAF